MGHVTRSAAVVCVLALLPTFAFADAPPAPKPKCAVLGVRAESGITQGTANLLSEIISTDVLHTNQYDVLTSADVAMMIGVERQRQLLGCNQNDNCFAEIGAALGTDLILDASVGSVGNLRVLAVRLYDAKKSRAVARESITVNDESALVDAAHLAVARVLGIHPPEGAATTVAGSQPSAATTATATHRRFHPALAGLIGAGVIAVVGGVFGILALSDYNAFKADPFNDPLGDSAKTKSYVADGLYAGALVVAIVATVLLLVIQ
jgi:hypothetical protein